MEKFWDTLNPRSKDYGILELVLGITILSGTFVIIFDILRKTLFLEASWNYQYPAWNFVYNIPAIGLLILTMGAASVLAPKFWNMDNRRFILTVYMLTILVSVLSFLALPEKTYRRALVPQDGLYYSVTILLEHGPLEFFSSFHSLGTLDTPGTGPEVKWAKELAAIFQSASYIPWNETLADYAGKIKIQKHGPIPAVLIAPFLLLFGMEPQNATLGSYVITSLLPVIGYLSFDLYFPERYSRAAAMFVLFTPTYIINQRSGPIAYDVIAAVLIGISVFYFLRWTKNRQSVMLVASGVFFSLGALTKITVLPLLLGYFLVFLTLSTDGKEVVEWTVGLAASALVIPTALLLAGYNFLVQYALTIYKVVDTTGKVRPAGSRNAYLNDPLMSMLAPIYNVRWIGPPLLILVAIFVLYATRRPSFVLADRRYAIGIPFLFPLFPFAALLGMTISRHMLPYLTAIGFMGLCGLALLENEYIHQQWQFNRFVQAGLLLTAGVTLVNL